MYMKKSKIFLMIGMNFLMSRKMSALYFSFGRTFDWQSPPQTVRKLIWGGFYSLVFRYPFLY